MKDVENIFNKYRFDPNSHLGLGDIRLTIADQEEIFKEIWNSAIDKAAESARLGNTENGVYNVLEVSKQSILKLKL